MVILLITLLVLKRLNSAWRVAVQLLYISYWLVHVEVAFQILTAFDCVDFMGDKVLAQDLTRMCFSNTDGDDGDHLKFLLSVCMPFGIIWLVAVPVGCLLLFAC